MYVHTLQELFLALPNVLGNNILYIQQYGHTALYLAAGEGKVDVVRLLIDAEAQVNIQTEVH